MMRSLPASRLPTSGVFLDYGSLPQKDAAGKRTEAEAATFAAGLSVMGFCYASITGTCVVQRKQIASAAVSAARGGR